MERDVCLIVDSNRGIIEGLNLLIKEKAILEKIEESLSAFITASINDIPHMAADERGKVWLSRFNARRKGSEFFFIQFAPSNTDIIIEGLRYSQCAIAEGNFLKKELNIFSGERVPDYVKRENIPVLRNIFEKFGFNVKVLT
jgi:hypothetical protein